MSYKSKWITTIYPQPSPQKIGNRTAFSSKTSEMYCNHFHGLLRNREWGLLRFLFCFGYLVFCVTSLILTTMKEIRVLRFTGYTSIGGWIGWDRRLSLRLVKISLATGNDQNGQDKSLSQRVIYSESVMNTTPETIQVCSLTVGKVDKCERTTWWQLIEFQTWVMWGCFDVNWSGSYR